MDNTFKINMYFDEEGEEVEKIIIEYLIKEINNANKTVKYKKQSSNIWIYEQISYNKCKFKLFYQA